jgi:steroid delta-isomerase-like uncharacterized protein
MSEQNKQAMRRFNTEVVEQGKLEVIDELLTDDFVEHAAMPGMANDRSAVRDYFTMVRAAFPDMRVEVHHMIAEGDLVAAYTTTHGTHKGDFMGIPATGKKVSIPGVDIVRFNDRGKAVEHWTVADQLVMMQQLGVVPEIAPAQ